MQVTARVASSELSWQEVVIKLLEVCFSLSFTAGYIKLVMKRL